MRHIYGDVPGYDVEHELRVIQNVIREERESAAALKKEYAWEILRGVNLVSARLRLFYSVTNTTLNQRRTLIACWPKCMQQLVGDCVV